MPRATPRPHMAPLVVLIGAALALAGCFGDDDPVATGPSGDDAPPDDAGGPLDDVIPDPPELPPPVVSVTYVNNAPDPDAEPEIEIEEPAEACDLVGRNLHVGLLGLGIGIDTCL